MSSSPPEKDNSEERKKKGRQRRRKSNRYKPGQLPTAKKKAEKKLEKKEKTSNKSPSRSYRGYDDLIPSERHSTAVMPVPLNYYFSTKHWWEPVDVGATTKQVPIQTGDQKDVSSLHVHDLYWREEKLPTEGQPRGFLQFSKPAQSDGKPKGFLSFLESTLPSKPKRTANLRPSSKNRSFFQFFDYIGDWKRQRRIMPSEFKESRADKDNVNEMFSPLTPKPQGKDRNRLSQLGGILPGEETHFKLPEKHEKPQLHEKEPTENKNVRNENSLPALELFEGSVDSFEEQGRTFITSSYPSLQPLETKDSETAETPPQFTEGRDWNAEFQFLMESLFDNEESIEKMRDLCECFAAVAKEIGTIIISELFLPPEDRTIPPVTGTMGGVAGGEKYVYAPERIFFKFAVDERGIYGGTEYIMKAAGQELKALMELMDCRVQGIHFPLMVLVDYRGYRLIAMPLLPVGPDTLVYGSADGGANIYTISCEMNARMQLIASILNLAGHNVWNLDHTEKTTVYGPVDIEGHLGRDDRFYILDAARLFPPAIPVAGLRGCHLYRLLRPEFVKNNPVPLCSDAYSTWEIEDIVSFNQDIAEATQRLETEVIPQFSGQLQDWYDQREQPFDLCKMKEYRRLKTAMHRRGVNLRCAGLVRQYIEEPILQKFILTEIVARVAKKILFGRMRQLHTADEYEYQALIADYYNLLFDHTQEAQKYWCQTIKNSLLKRFTNALFAEERDRTYDLRASISMVALFLRMNNICDFEFDSGAVEEVFEYDYDMHCSTDYSCCPLFTSDDIVKISAAERSIHQIDFAEGTILSRRAAHAEDGAEELFAIADERFQATLERKPDDYRALHNWALSLLYRANRKQGEEAAKLYTLACSKIAASLILNEEDAVAYLLWGNILSEQALRSNSKAEAYNLFLDAVSKYEESYRYEPKSFELSYNWGNALLHLSKHTDDRDTCENYLLGASERYAEATEIESDHKAYRNWGVVLSKLARLSKNTKEAQKLFCDAEEKFSLSLEGTSADSEVYFNWGNVRYHRASTAASRKEFRAAFEQLVHAGEKYMAALECGSGYNFDALINWGKVLNLQIHLAQQDHPPDYSLSLVVELYLASFTSVVMSDEYNDGYSLSLKPILGLAKADDSEIASKAINCLINLSESHIPSLKEEASRALRIAKRQLGSNIKTENPPFQGQHPTVSTFLQKLEATRTTSLRTQQSTREIIPLSDFQRLSDVGATDTCCTVVRKGAPELYTLKVRIVDKSPRQSYENQLRHSSELLHARMMRIIQGQMPFLARILYSYKKDCNYYLIEEYISDDHSLSKLRQTIYFKNCDSRSGSFSSQKRLSLQSHLPCEEATQKRISKIKSSTQSKHSSLPRKNGATVEKLCTKELVPLSRSVSATLSPKSGSIKVGPPKFARETMPEYVARFFIAEIIIVLGYLHSLGFIYGNLTPTTIHLDNAGHICLTKFSYLLEGAKLQDDITTTAPEVLSGGLFMKEADWWEVGTLLYEFLTSKMPQEGCDGSNLSPEAKSLISALLEVNSKKRLGRGGVEEIKNHEFFKEFDWEKAENRKLTPPISFKSDTSASSYSGDDDLDRAPTIVAQMQDADFHQHSMVNPTLSES